MATKQHKTNAMRMLEAAQVDYVSMSYEVDESDLSGVHAAAMLGLEPEVVFKTLVCKAHSGGHVVCCIPVAEELDLKKAARAAGEKSLEMLPLRDLLPTTGYIRGGCSPLGMKKAFPTLIDETAILFDQIGVSAGERGVQMMLAPDDLVAVLGAQYADLCK